MFTLRLALLALFAFSLCFAGASGKSKQSKQVFSPSKETSSASFITLLLMRLVFGLASVMGFRENLANLMGGVLVPPGADDYDDYSDDFLPELFR